MGDIEISAVGHLHICSQVDMMDICQGKEDGCYDFEANLALFLQIFYIEKFFIQNIRIWNMENWMVVFIRTSSTTVAAHLICNLFRKNFPHLIIFYLSGVTTAQNLHLKYQIHLLQSFGQNALINTDQ